MKNIPKNSKEKITILTDRITTPLGPMCICATQKGICFLNFVDQDLVKKYLKKSKKDNEIFLFGENEHIKQLKKELSEYFSKKRKKFEVSLDLIGTDFQKKTWQVLRKIPYGKTFSYKKQAEEMKNPKAIRAVGTANGKNKILIVIPCHRVISNNGKLGGFTAGLERKKWLLNHELKK
jgi:AraC family transcriptional regulator, regulatory protein of adaptative response / methylated-DNA-[protein]-cysteine methyltransferase